MPYGVVKESGKKYAVVQLERQEMCGECHACDYVSGKKSCKLKCEKQIECEAGDTVELLLAQSSFLKATYIMYGTPLVGLVIGLVLGYFASKLLSSGREDLYVLVGAIVGIGIALLIIKWGEKKGKFKKYLPQIIAIRK